MNKKLLLFSGAGLLIVLLVFVGRNQYAQSLSPPATALYDSAGLSVQVQYCQPRKKGRLIFGRETDQALVPYGKVWRTGANEATLITFGQDTEVGDTKVPAGTYSLWSVPGPAKWQLVLNRETGQWGTQYNDGKDLARIPIPIRVKTKVRENFKIYFEPAATGTNMVLAWDQTEAVVPLKSIGSGGV